MRSFGLQASGSLSLHNLLLFGFLVSSAWIDLAAVGGLQDHFQGFLSLVDRLSWGEIEAGRGKAPVDPTAGVISL